ncbi:bacterial alpha-L-rhamnosidase domain-containing protein [Seiridium cupressi]
MAFSVPFLGVLVLWLVVGAHPTLAQTCWRDTPCNGPQDPSFPGEWDENIFAPPSRTVHPSAYLEGSGRQMDVPLNALRLDVSQPSVVVDFGLEVGGIITLDYVVASVEGSNAVGLAFSEAKDFIGPNSDSTTGNYARPDGALYANFSQAGNFTYVMPDAQLRGGFRYMTLFLQPGSVAIEIRNISLEIAFQPTWANLRAYQGYFHSNDDLLNRIWYSGAYTLQTDAVHPSTGRAWPPPETEWANDGFLGPGDTILTDGAKRDRTVWPGDLGVAVPASFYSTGDLESTKNGLQSLYDYQDPTTGELPFSGVPLEATHCISYHMWTMIGTYNYVLYSDDLDFLSSNWDKYKLAMSYVFSQIDGTTGLINSDSSSNDWGRLHANGTLTSLQATFYRALVTGAQLADWVGDKTGLGVQWLEDAEGLQTRTNAINWDDSAGAFFDVTDRPDIHPQDGNSLAVYFGIVNATSNEARNISDYLIRNWTPIGAECEELPGEISPFISSFEIQAHLLTGNTQRALDLIRSAWGWYLDHPNGTQSTMVEGYLVNGTWGYRWDAGYQNDFSYTSHAHGWATGPVTALTERVLGLSITGRAGATWRLAPQIGDLTQVEGGFTTRLGKFSAGWTKEADGTINLEYDVPEGTTGDVVVQIDAADVVSKRNDGDMMRGRAFQIVQGSGGGRAVVIKSGGGKHSYVFR